MIGRENFFPSKKRVFKQIQTKNLKEKKDKNGKKEKNREKIQNKNKNPVTGRFMDGPGWPYIIFLDKLFT